MSALTDRITAEHVPLALGTQPGLCSCGASPDNPGEYISSWRARHMAEVTEAAVREHIAAALDDLARVRHDDLKETKRRTRAESFAGASAMAYELAARIARGEL